MRHVETTQKDFIEWIFKTIMGFLFSILLYILSNFGEKLQRIEGSVHSLNTNIAKTIEKVSNQGKRIDRMDLRINRIQYKEKNK